MRAENRELIPSSAGTCGSLTANSGPAPAWTSRRPWLAPKVLFSPAGDSRTDRRMSPHMLRGNHMSLQHLEVDTWPLLSTSRPLWILPVISGLVHLSC